MTRRARFWLKFLAWSAGAVVVLLIAGIVAVSVLHARYKERAAKFDLTKIDDVAERSAVYDGNGEFYSYFGGENRLVVPLAQVSRHFLNALLAREDSRFWEHRGVDTKGVLRAFLANVRAGETKQGASTLTQQLARNACGLAERSLDRKALEAVLAQRIEEQYTKGQILELYVNRIYFGAGYYGIEAAARGYFGKPAAELTLGESATLAALIRNPNRLAPSRDLGAALEQRDVVLARMAELKLITDAELAAAKAQQLTVTASHAVRVTDDDVMDAVLRELSTLLSPETLEYGGLKISMTIDPQLQRLAQAAADRRLSEIEEQKGFPHPKKKDFVPETTGGQEKPTNYLQASVVLVDNRTGAVRAVVGGRDYAQSKYSRALLSKRQIGSTFKPFVYAAAFERGMLPGSSVDDSKIAAGEFKDLPKSWSPENSDGEYSGLQPASFGLLKSRNTMSVRVGEFAGLAKVRELAQATGLSDHMPDLPVVFLGAFETTVKDLTAAYTIFPNHGVYRAPYLISQVEDRVGRVLWRAPLTEKRVLAPETAWMISSILQQIMKTGTASKSAALGWKKNGAGKTGTTNDFFDAWFVGYTTSLTCGVWVGLDQPATIMEKGYGSALALPIWVDIMQQVSEKEYPSAPFEPGMTMTKVAICSISGGRATSTCVAQRCAYELPLPSSRAPQEPCRTHPEPTAAPVVIATAPLPAPAPSTTSATLLPPVASSAGPPAGQASRAVTVAPTTFPAVQTVEQNRPALPPTSLVEQVSPAPAAQPVAPRAAPAGYAAQDIIRPGRQADSIPREPLIGEAGAPSPAALPAAVSRSGARDRTPAARVSGEALPSATTSPSAPVVSAPRATPVTRTAPAAPPARTEVRRALPVEQRTNPDRTGAAASTPLPEGVSEQRIVEKLPDGRTRTTTIRKVRIPER